MMRRGPGLRPPLVDQLAAWLLAAAFVAGPALVAWLAGTLP